MEAELAVYRRSQYVLFLTSVATAEDMKLAYVDGMRGVSEEPRGLSAEEEFFGAEFFYCVAEFGGFFEFEFLGGFAHVGF